MAAVVRDLLAGDPDARIPTAAQAAERLERTGTASVPAGEDWTAVSFELPQNPRPAEAAASGFLTGLPETAWAEIVSPTVESASDTLGPDPRVATPVSLPSIDTRHRPARPRREAGPASPRGVSPLVMAVLASSMVVICLLAIGALMRWASR